MVSPCVFVCNLHISTMRVDDTNLSILLVNRVMSRRKLQWKKAIAQAGGDPMKILPRNAKGRGIRGIGIDKELLGDAGKSTVGSGKGTQCTVGMKPETEAKFLKLK